VPLVLWGPLPFRGGTVREDPALLVDLLPTILAAFRIGPDWRLPGRSLDSAEPEDPVEAYAEAVAEELAGEDGAGAGAAGSRAAPVRSLRAGGWKLIDADPRRLYHLAADPDERHDLAAEEPERVESLRRRLQEIAGP
jgi:arylsulfatase A-like enzyme